MSKKRLLSLALIVIMIAILSMSSLAWFTDKDSVKNEFMIADSNDDTADEIFSVDVWENTPDTDKNQDDYTYKDILPGDVLKKVAVVENTGYYNQYVRVIVTVTGADAWMKILDPNGNGKLPALGEIVTGLDTTAWYEVDPAQKVDDSIVYTLYYSSILEGNGGDDTNTHTATVFEAVEIPKTMTQAQAAAFGTSFSITVVAEAVQTENLGIDSTAADAAYQAFAVVNS